MLIFRELEFHSSHHLPFYEGKCSEVHGHTYICHVGVEGEVNQETGMVIDFSKMKNALAPLEKILDHRDLNVIFDNPTAEIMALYIIKWCKIQWEYLDLPGKVRVVRLWETPRNFVEVSE